MATKIREVCSFGPVQELYEAAKKVADHNPRGSAAKLTVKMGDLIDAVRKVEKAAVTSDGLAHVRKIAEDLYVDSACDIDIDENNFTHHNGKDGYWVGAWLWVSDGEAEEDQLDDTDA